MVKNPPPFFLLTFFITVLYSPRPIKLLIKDQAATWKSIATGCIVTHNTIRR
jgi:hypothetical protein